MIIKDWLTNDSGRVRRHRNDNRSPLELLPIGAMITAVFGVIIFLASLG